MIQIVQVAPSTRKGKRFMAEWSDGTVTHFGDITRPSYPFHKDRDRKRKYMLRHRKDLNTGDPRRAGFMSWFILWQFTSVDVSIRTYNRWLRMCAIKARAITDGTSKARAGFACTLPVDMELYARLERVGQLSSYEHIMNDMGLTPWVAVGYLP